MKSIVFAQSRRLEGESERADKTVSTWPWPDLLNYQRMINIVAPHGNSTSTHNVVPPFPTPVPLRETSSHAFPWRPWQMFREHRTRLVALMHLYMAA